MGNFNRGGNGGGGYGGNRGGGRDGGRPSFQKKSWGGGGNDRPAQMFKATCSECNKACEVPFRPTNGKPVFCSECFGNNKGNDREDKFSSRPSYSERSERPSYSDRNRGGSQPESAVDVHELKKQIEILNVKMDRLLREIESMNGSKAPQAQTQAPAQKPREESKTTLSEVVKKVTDSDKTERSDKKEKKAENPAKKAAKKGKK